MVSIVVTKMRVILLCLFVCIFIISNVFTLKIAIVGSGPCGLLLASKIISSDTKVNEIDIYEYREDPRIINDDKSFAIGVNPRSLQVLLQLNNDLVEYLKQNSFSYVTNTSFISEKKIVDYKMPKRYMTTQPLITRGLLNWLDKAKIKSNCKLNTYFNSKVISVDSNNGILYTTSTNNPNKITTKDYDLIVGADGARSTVRQSIIQQSNVSFEKYITNIRWKFIPLRLNCLNNTSAFYGIRDTIGGWWHMPTGLTHLVMFWKPKDKQELTNPPFFKSITNVKDFLKKLFPSEPLDIDNASLELYNNPAYSETVFKMNQYYHVGGKVVVIGDAAHQMNTVLGQGMSCGFEDVSALYNNLSMNNWSNIPLAIQSYSNERVKEGNAMTDLNFVQLIDFKWKILFELIQRISKLIIPNYQTFRELIVNPSIKYSSILKKYNWWFNIGSNNKWLKGELK